MEETIVPTEVAPAEAVRRPPPSTSSSDDEDDAQQQHQQQTRENGKKSRPFQHYEIFKGLRDVSVHADRGLISIGEFRYVRRAIHYKGERILNPLMRHMFRAMVQNIISYAVANRTLPPPKVLKQWQTEFIFSLLPDGRTPPLHDDWAFELRDSNGHPPPSNKKREAKEDASYKVNVVVKPIRAKQYTVEDVPSYLELPRIHFCNIAASIDVSSLPYGLHTYVIQLIEHIGDEYARNEPFVQNHARYSVIRKAVESANFKHDEEYVRDVLEPKVHEQRSAEAMFVDRDANEEIPEGQSAATAFESSHRMDMTPYDRFYCKYYYGKQHADRMRSADDQIAEQARASLKRARQESEESNRKKLAIWDARGKAMVEKAYVEQQERDAKLGVSDDDSMLLPPKSPRSLTQEQIEAMAKATVANVRKQRQQQQRRSTNSGKGGKKAAK